jgi:hypothetical protein
LNVVSGATHGAYFFIFILCLTIVILFYLVGRLVTVVTLSSHSSLSANVGATCDSPVPVSAVSIPIDSAANINTFFVFKICYRKMILNKV